jgi:dTDP-4-dehydrorhamnose 3,5-epimerase-like enzyme
MSELLSPDPQALNKLPLGVEFLDFSVHGDHRGSLISVESQIHVPFQIARVYTLFHTTTDTVRGCHAHRDTRQLILNVSGSYTLLLDDGNNRLSVEFTRPGTGVYIHGYVWRELSNFSDDSVINCYVDKHYEDSVYMRDYHQFIAEAGSQ